MIVGDGLDGPLDELVALLLETLSVSVLPGVDTSAVIVVLRRGRRGSGETAVSVKNALRDSIERKGVWVTRTCLRRPEPRRQS